jgi:hypothetical protein
MNNSKKCKVLYSFHKVMAILSKNPNLYRLTLNTVILSFLKRERERFRLFVPKRYYVPARTFLGVPDRSAFTIPDRFHDRFWPILNVSERSMSVFDRFMSVFERLRPFYDQKSSETVRNGEERWTLRNVRRSGTLTNGQERSGTVRNGER